ncbi:transposable element Tcb2 transposase [Trichonephila clavipes]|nr:transposable element Tcb2 transposase [Trichonephila clavipes]
MDPTCQQGTVQAGGGSVMVWGVFIWRDMGPLIRPHTTLAGDRYVSILSDHLHPFISIVQKKNQHVHSDGLEEFQQDNATPHTSRIATEKLPGHSSEFRQFLWPPKSPDRSIIEYIWYSLQRAFQKTSLPLIAPTHLWLALQDSWCQLPPALLQTFI